MITPQQAYEKRYAAIDNGQHTWEAAPDHVKDLWLAAWTIAWVQAEAAELLAALEACVDVMLDKGIPVDKEHPHRIALGAAEAAISKAKEIAQ